MTMRRHTGGFFLIIAALCLLFQPDDALAWGPAVHLHSAMQLLSGAAAVAPALLELLRRHSRDFLYGTLAADFIIGKKHARHIDHCHNWEVARSLMREARLQGSHREAFMYGYFNHLGADVVAHTHVVPEMLVVHFAAKGVGHMYWESRADRRILSLYPEIQEAWSSLSTMNFPGHDRFLWDNLSPTLFSNKISAGIYRGNLVMQRNLLWRKLLLRIDAGSRLKFDQEQLLLWIQLAAQSGARATDNPWSKRLDHLDPIGIESLAWAEESRKKLRYELRRHGHTAPLAEAVQAALAKSKTVDIHHFEEDWV